MKQVCMCNETIHICVPQAFEKVSSPPDIGTDYCPSAPSIVCHTYLRSSTPSNENFIILSCCNVHIPMEISKPYDNDIYERDHQEANKEGFNKILTNPRERNKSCESQTTKK